MAHEHKLTAKRQLEPLKNSRWFYGLSMVVIVICFFMPLELGIWIILFMVGLPLTLQLLLHLNYYFHDRSTTLIVDFGHGTIDYTNGDKSLSISFDNIARIIRTQGSRYPKPSELYVIPSNFYHYTTIETTNGERLKFTDLLYPNFSISTKKSELRVKPLLNWIK